jgi:hypothetical protein
MTKYSTEGNINFYDELFKSLDDSDDDDDTQLCQITGLPLIDKSVILECKHHFNYDALYTEICRQKYDFKTYTVNALSKTEYSKVINSKLDYFIKCPYCRNIQFTILPYYEELGLKQKYGVNSLDKKLKITDSTLFPSYSNILDGKTFFSGKCCHLYTFTDPNTGLIKKYNCSNQHVTVIDTTNLTYCTSHYNKGLKNHNLSIKNAAKQALKEQKEKNKQIKEEAKEEAKKEKQLLLETQNKEREANGLPPLKKIKLIKNKIENTIKQPQIISQYIPEENGEEQLENICKAVLKSGPNKGKQCFIKAVNNCEFCKRHTIKEEPQDLEK